jgi:hypothetical protein
MDRPLLPLTELERLLVDRPQVADAVRRVVGDLRPCVRLETSRASAVPIKGHLLDRLRGARGPASLLSVTVSKFGGRPYCERIDELRSRRFLGQIWRIDADAAAGFSWGTNWLYVVIHKSDLERGAFEHSLVTAANA